MASAPVRMNSRLLILFIGLSLPRAQAADVPHARLDERQREFFKDYCVECHNAEKHKGKLRLDDISLSIESVEHADRWQKILNQLNSGAMPPVEAK